LLQSLPKEYSESSSATLLETVLQLLVEQLRKLSHSGFFAADLHEYVKHLCRSVESLQGELHKQDRDVTLVSQVVEAIWRATQFLAGTTSNKVPYEFTYLLREVLHDWDLRDTIVTTSLHQAPDFSCQPAQMAPSVLLRALGMDQLLGHGELVQMGLPEIFQHMPLLCTPLYHEVAHYIEERYKFVPALLISHPDDVVNAVPDVKVFNDKDRRDRAARMHMTEHFCDLVAAAYVGRCVSDYVNQWDRDPSFRDTHPSAESRAGVTMDFLLGRPNPVVSLLTDAVARARLNIKLECRYSLPDVHASFSDVRPAQITSIAELHGLLPAADEFLRLALDAESDLTGHNIASVPRDKRARLVNDLVEKCIRSFMITKAWHESLDKKAIA